MSKRKHYHTLTQAHINHALQLVINRERYKGVRVSDAVVNKAMKMLLSKGGFNPRQLANACANSWTDKQHIAE